MRVHIEHGEEQKGLFIQKSFPTVTLRIEFSEEEQHIISSQRLDQTIIMERPPSRQLKVYEYDNFDKFHLRIAHILNFQSDVWFARDILEAKEYAAELEDCVRSLKEFLEGNAELDTQNRTFEL